MTTKRIKLDNMTMAANIGGGEMFDFLEPVTSQAKSVEQTLTQMESDITSIRSTLENKPKKLSLKDINRKLDIIIKMLNG